MAADRLTGLAVNFLLMCYTTRLKVSIQTCWNDETSLCARHYINGVTECSSIILFFGLNITVWLNLTGDFLMMVMGIHFEIL